MIKVNTQKNPFTEKVVTIGKEKYTIKKLSRRVMTDIFQLADSEGPQLRFNGECQTIGIMHGLTKWPLVDENETPLEITEDNLEYLPQAAFNRLFNEIFMYSTLNEKQKKKSLSMGRSRKTKTTTSAKPVHTDTAPN